MVMLMAVLLLVLAASQVLCLNNFDFPDFFAVPQFFSAFFLHLLMTGLFAIFLYEPVWRFQIFLELFPPHPAKDRAK